MPHCMVPNCTNGSRKTKGSDVSYHRLPNDPTMQKIWLARVRRDNIPKPNSCYVCSDHFTPDCFSTSLKEIFGMKSKKIEPSSVPSTFPFLNRKPERKMSHRREQMRDRIARHEEVRSIIQSLDEDTNLATCIEDQPPSPLSKDAQIQCELSLMQKHSVIHQDKGQLPYKLLHKEKETIKNKTLQKMLPLFKCSFFKSYTKTSNIPHNS
ncbi:peroxynitrite isomerase THAP4-like [Xenia sp. Carnegie-2017]|uniref:peroxynitrite isomerase THAP4-like n=1 Tax=Xenia sp. Carnegie-2017 TaxID=2897299 RepID=UPI001F042CC8|nr:peroxynitrite isomerase THAP4-like [Xenia sp. Carnegie-2017]